jgi:phosphoglycolate phosphatase-like HAD superfamily hydrolase
MNEVLLHKVILWDFDGVIINSLPIREEGFHTVLKAYPDKKVNDLIKFHRANGGLSRYVKFKYFFEEIMGHQNSDENVLECATEFKHKMLKLLKNKSLLNSAVVNFISSNYKSIPMHIVSGSDETELNEICKHLDLDDYFKSIKGSPTPKDILINEIIQANGYNKNDICLIGDSVNDFDAAQVNQINFFGYNNVKLKQYSELYINRF